MFSFYKQSETFLSFLADEIEKRDLESLFDVEYSDGILTILVHKTEAEYVINRHSANSKIWYSSPISGADYFTFDNDAQKWFNNKGEELQNKLFLELAQFKN